jgi:hypothetical protein
MPRTLFIKGCGQMVCSTYAEMTAEIDRAYAAPPGRPITLREISSGLLVQATSFVRIETDVVAKDPGPDP